MSNTNCLVDVKLGLHLQIVDKDTHRFNIDGREDLKKVKIIGSDLF